MGTGAATIASAGAALGIGKVLSSESYFRLSERERESKMIDRLQELQRLSNFL
jgi:hypothetical protein